VRCLGCRLSVARIEHASRPAFLIDAAAYFAGARSAIA